MSTWRIDAAHTDITFKAKHMMLTTVRGRFDEIEGTLRLDEEQPTNSGGEVRVAAGSLSTGFEARDQHLRSGDFFDVEQHPWIEFRSVSVEPREGPRFAVTGEVTIKGISVPVVFDVEYQGAAAGMRGGRHASLTARATVNRRDWGLNWNMALEAGGWLVSDEIVLEIDVAADEVEDAVSGSVDDSAEAAVA
jgi:polyisoprenoid-binding protein YceI